MSSLSWAPDVVGIPRPDGLEIWNTTSGALWKIPSDAGTSLPDLSEMSPDAIDHLCRERMLEETGKADSGVSGRTGVLGLPASSLAQGLQRCPRPDIMVLGVALDIGVSAYPGARHGPAVLRHLSTNLPGSVDEAGRVQGVFDAVTGPSALNGTSVLDVGDLFAVPSDPRRPRSKAYSAVETSTRCIVGNGVRPLLLGGDHSITAPAFLAVSEHETVGLVVLDAHLDAEEPDITRFEQLTHVNFLSQILALRPNTNVFVLGVREPIGASLWPLPEQIKCFSVARGMEFLRELPPMDLYLSVDVDVLDPSVFPATGHPVPGGIMVSELAEAILDIGNRHRVVAADLVEATHSREYDYLTGQIGGHIVRRLLEAMARAEARS